MAMDEGCAFGRAVMMIIALAIVLIITLMLVIEHAHVALRAGDDHDRPDGKSAPEGAQKICVLAGVSR